MDERVTMREVADQIAADQRDAERYAIWRLRVGTIELRHQLPVEEFLFSAAKGDPMGERGVEVNVKNAPLYTRVRVDELLEKHPSLREIYLFYTGLTDVTVSALLAFVERGLTVVLFRYDTGAQRFEPYLVWNKGESVEFDGLEASLDAEEDLLHEAMSNRSQSRMGLSWRRIRRMWALVGRVKAVTEIVNGK